jgi:hypothetical protein
MPKIPIPPFEPDAHDTDAEATDHAVNVIPKKRGWGPLPAPESASDALSGVCRGAFTAQNADGTFEVFAGTATGLFQLSGSSWDDVTRLVGGGYNLASGHSWSWEQFGPRVIAVNVNDDPQSFNLASSTDFAVLGGSPPRARYVGAVGDYLQLYNLLNAERKFRRSGVNDAEEWDIGEEGADFQELPAGGFLRGAAGDENGAYLFSETKIWRQTLLPTSEIGFSVQEWEPRRGCIAPDSLVQVGRDVFYLAETGFFRLPPGAMSIPIGATRVNDFFLADVDLDDLDQVQGCADPVRPIVWWRYKSQGSGSLDTTDKMLGYDWQLDRWCYAEVQLEWLFQLAMPGMTLEQVAVLYPNLETVPFSFDSRFWNAGRPALAGFDAAHRLVMFEGGNMAATVRTPEYSFFDGRRAFVSGFRPVTDAADCTGQIGVRGAFAGAITWSTPGSANSATGLIPIRASGRTHRFEVGIAADAEWKNLTEIEVPPECVRPQGRR